MGRMSVLVWFTKRYRAAGSGSKIVWALVYTSNGAIESLVWHVGAEISLVHRSGPTPLLPG